ncbi:MAG: hypothetical protein JST24_09545 [Acidobacteria bacterium]|nr:hypothetical protein [Acidobacteriota bacterium]
MNRSTKNLLLGLAGALFATGALMAQTPTQKREAHATQRDINQQKRIEQGEKSGQLTPKEAARVERQEGRIDKAEAKADADGHVSKKEAKHINRMQNRESKRIYRQKHDRQRTK